MKKQKQEKINRHITKNINYKRKNRNLSKNKNQKERRFV